jgi:hypothetical protein
MLRQNPYLEFAIVRTMQSHCKFLKNAVMYANVSRHGTKQHMLNSACCDILNLNVFLRICEWFAHCGYVSSGLSHHKHFLMLRQQISLHWYLLYTYVCCTVTRGSSGSIVSYYRLGYRGSIPGRDNGFFL